MDTDDVVPVRQLVNGFDDAMRRGVVTHLVPHLPAGVSPTDVRTAFVRQLSRARAGCWQDAWDAWVARGGGSVTVECHRCERCSGRRIDMRRGQVCHVCHGTGRNRHELRVPAHQVPRPSPTV